MPRAVCLDPRSRNFFSSKKEEEAKTEEAAPELSEAEAALHERIAELEEKNAEYFDKYRRSLADFENLRNRMNKQVADAKIFGIQSFCKDLLDVADVLGKAISVVPQEALQESQYLRDMHQGLQLTESQILKVFEKHGLVQENPLGQKFDPNKHDALFQIPAPDKEPNTVLDVQKVGYILQGRDLISMDAGGYSDLCADPPCDSAELMADPGSGSIAAADYVDGVGNPIECATLQARPDETKTWEICPDGVSQLACADRKSVV